MITVIIAIAVAYGLFHLATATPTSVTAAPAAWRRRSTGAPTRGPWVSVRLPGGFRVGHRL